MPYAESLGALTELQRQGKIRHIGISEQSHPALTTVRQPVHALASAAVDAAFALVRGEHVERIRVLPPELIVRESAPAISGGR